MTKPTDAELDAVLCNQWPAFSTQATLVRVWVRAAMRDALAKWGAHPAVAGEPIGHLYCGGSYGDELADWEIVADQHQCDKLNEHHGSLGKEAKLPIYTTPQPTQAQAGAVPMYRLLQSGVDRIEAADEFLSDDTTTWAIDPNGIFSGNIYGGHVLRPARRRIKGGQHGAE